MDDPSSSAALTALLIIVIGLFYLLIIAGAYVLNSWILGRIFDKVGEQKWAAWVPVYNYWVFLKIGGQPGWLSILMLVPGANFVAAVFLCIAAYKIGIGFGKSGAWVLLFIFFPLIWMIIIAFDSSPWEPWRIPTAEAPYGYMPPPGYVPPQHPSSGYGAPPAAAPTYQPPQPGYGPYPPAPPAGGYPPAPPAPPAGPYPPAPPTDENGGQGQEPPIPPR